MTRALSLADRLLAAADRALRTVAAPPVALRASPALHSEMAEAELTDAERRDAAALMRVNHVGEVCAQALYDAQALATRDPAMRALFERAASEETDHLAWTQARIEQLGGRTSLLNPLWYTGAFAIGLIAARAGGCASIVRIPSNDVGWIKRVIDSGAELLPHGVDMSADHESAPPGEHCALWHAHGYARA